MKLALVVVGDGRREYLQQSVPAATRHILHPINARIMVDDSGNPAYGDWLDQTYPEFIHVHGGRRGMAGAVQAGFTAALEHDPDYVCWVEEDMVLLRDLPVAGAAQVLDAIPELAQVTFKRKPWWGREVDLDDQLAAICEAAPNHGERERYTWHDHIFSLNPCVIPARILKRGWPAGNEAEMTQQLLADGYLFATWGHVGDEPFVEHIGERRGDGWRL